MIYFFNISIWQGALPSRLYLTFISITNQSTYLNSYSLSSCWKKTQDEPECGGGACPLTVQHIMIGCVDFSHIRSRVFDLRSMKDCSIQLHLQFYCMLGLFDFFTRCNLKLRLCTKYSFEHILLFGWSRFRPTLHFNRLWPF